jgi:bifunctional non-homologous end joining protein LigD
MTLPHFSVSSATNLPKSIGDPATTVTPKSARRALELDGEDLRPRPLSERKARLAKLLGSKTGATVFNEHTDEDGATVFQHACKLGFEGIVSKRLSARYRSGPSRDWIKVKNPDSPAMVRAREFRW